MPLRINFAWEFHINKLQDTFLTSLIHKQLDHSGETKLLSDLTCELR